MAFGQIISIFSAIVGVALVAVILASPNTASLVTAFTNGFANSLKAATGA